MVRCSSLSCGRTERYPGSSGSIFGEVLCSALSRGRLAWLIEGSLSRAVIVMNYDKPPARQAEVPTVLLPDRNLMEDAQMGSALTLPVSAQPFPDVPIQSAVKLQVARFRSPPSSCRGDFPETQRRGCRTCLFVYCSPWSWWNADRAHLPDCRPGEWFHIHSSRLFFQTHTQPSRSV